jgi:hypothetical protein
MKRLLFLFVLLAIVIGISPIYAQAQLSGVLTVESVMGYVIQMNLTVSNIGNQPFSHQFSDSEISFFSIDGVEQHEAVLPVILPYSLDPGETDTFTMINFYPLSSGAHTIQAYFAVYNTQNEPLALGEPVVVTIAQTIAVNFGDSAELSRIPVDFYWRNSLYECIYTAEELGHTAGWITAVSFYPQFTTESMMQQPLSIYLGNTTLNNLTDDWADPFDMGLNFYGNVDFPIGQEEVLIPLQYGVYYNGTGNLVMMVFRAMTPSYQYTVDPFHAVTADPLRSRKAYSDAVNLHPLNPPDPVETQHIGFMPKTTFYLIPAEPSGNSDDNVPAPGLSVSHYPNPVMGSCTFKLQTDSALPASIEIYNLRGQKVNTLNDNAGNMMQWDTKDASGKLCPAGMYFYRCKAGKSSVTQRMIILR